MATSNAGLQRTLDLEQEYAEMGRKIQVLKQATLERRTKIAQLKKTPGLDAETRTQLDALEANELKSDVQIEALQREQDTKKTEIEALKRLSRIAANSELSVACTTVLAGTTLQAVIKDIDTLKTILGQTITNKAISDQKITLANMLVQSVITNMSMKRLEEEVTETVKLTHDAATACNAVKKALRALIDAVAIDAAATYNMLVAAVRKACNECNVLFTTGSPFEPQSPAPKPLVRELRFTMTTSGTAESDGCGNVRPIHQREPIRHQEQEEEETVTVSYKGSSMSSGK